MLCVGCYVVRVSHYVTPDAYHTAVCRSFFPNLMQRLKAKIQITPEFTALVTGHGKTRSYLDRFKLADEPMCRCNEGQQTSDHVIFDCNLLEAQGGPTIKKIVENGGY